jgi:hypothetical protein
MYKFIKQNLYKVYTVVVLGYTSKIELRGINPIEVSLYPGVTVRKPPLELHNWAQTAVNTPIGSTNQQREQKPLCWKFHFIGGFYHVIGSRKI